MFLPRVLKFLKKKKKKPIINKKIIVVKTKVSPSVLTKKIKRPLRSTLDKEGLIAKITHYFPKIKVAVLRMKGKLKLNEKIHIKGHTTDFKQVVTSMQINHKSITKTTKGQIAGLSVRKRVRHNDNVYKFK